MKQLITILIGAVVSMNAYAQNNDTIQTKKELPFFIHPSKRIADDELIPKLSKSANVSTSSSPRKSAR
jgi:hypothetical protein